MRTPCARMRTARARIPLTGPARVRHACRCGEWKPDPYGPLRMFTCTKEKCHYFLDFDGSGGYGALEEKYFPMNGFIGGWILVAITAASMSTGDGAILAMSTVFAHNVLRKVCAAAARSPAPS